MKMLHKCILTLLLFSSAWTAYSQAESTRDFYDSIKYYDLSKLWSSDSLLNLAWVDDTMYFDPKMEVFPEPIGFIGNDYQRFYIHFTSVIKNKKNPYQYDVRGKTKVKNTRHAFKGTITIYSADTYKVEHSPPIIRGYVSCHYKFYEDSDTAGSGCLEGDSRSDWCIYHHRLRYDNIDGIADGYCNNMFTGTWTNYKTRQKLKCNWGNERIPDSKGLDVGAGEFSVNEKYLPNGWSTYQELHLGGEDTVKQQKLLEIENKK